MQRKQMPYSEQIECAEVLYGFRDLLQRASRGNLPVLIAGNAVIARFSAFLRLDLLDEAGKLKDDFRRVLDGVIGDRAVDDLDYQDYEVVASRYRLWYPRSRLGWAWHSASYDLHSATTRVR